ncbi:putative GDSL esterase/lipase [Cocos nucifera]|uniref:Putative GDSL esterase/lipase n=1 Tax=Cocos nucifera TaxID=13894 RepID=A0A8K0HYK1_COCNU|nr:putative GDSL esterase/lipase [Cocos nucifera]
MKPSILLYLLFSSLHLSFSVSDPYTAIFSFGDSLADTGNHLVDGPNPILSTTHPPYGMTFFRRPTGRCSDGRLVIDFITEAFGLPLLPPSKAHNTDFHKGANFAITGGTAMSFAYFHKRGLESTVWVNGSLSDQIDWFQDMKPSLCSSAEECKEYFRRCLFVVGEFGGNDYNAFFFAGRGIKEVISNVSVIVGGIVEGVERLINQGAVDLVVPGVFPIGCFPLYLKLYGSKHKEDYGRRSGCLKKFNTLAWYHNEKLRVRLEKLQKNYPSTRIVYADYYAAAIRFNLAPKNFAEAFGLPLLPPSLARGQSFHQGANFAVAGATALDVGFFQQRGLGDSVSTNDSLSVQLRWFEELKPSLCGTTKDCEEYFSKSLFMVGEIGDNDYGLPIFARRSFKEAKSYVPKIIETISMVTGRLIELGAMELVVPGSLPLGCVGWFLTMYMSPNKEDYDPQTGCLNKLNALSRYHNALLRRELEQLQSKYPQTRIIYGDYYGAAMRLMRSPENYGSSSYIINTGNVSLVLVVVPEYRIEL